MASSDKKFLLGRRVNHPLEGRWFLPGGRIIRNESVKRALSRTIKEELGIKPLSVTAKFLGVGEFLIKSRHSCGDRHNVTLIFMVGLKRPMAVLNFDRNQHSEIRWFSRIEKNWHPYIKDTLKMARFNL